MGWEEAGCVAPFCSARHRHLPQAALVSPQLLSAASLFQLDALQRHCEILCSQTLSVESAVSTYKYAKVRPQKPARRSGSLTQLEPGWEMRLAGQF